MAKENKPEKPEQTFTGKQEPTKQNNLNVGKVPTKRITFRENRKFDLHVGRKMVTFKGRETKPVPVTWLKHPDFLQVSNLFIIKGV